MDFSAVALSVSRSAVGIEPKVQQFFACLVWAHSEYRMLVSYIQKDHASYRMVTLLVNKKVLGNI